MRSLDVAEDIVEHEVAILLHTQEEGLHKEATGQVLAHRTRHHHEHAARCRVVRVNREHFALGLIVVVRHHLVVDRLLPCDCLHLSSVNVRVSKGTLLVVETVQELWGVVHHVVVLVYE
mgnify:CR=1 FL=1